MQDAWLRLRSATAADGGEEIRDVTGWLVVAVPSSPGPSSPPPF
ncbi:hypothetical protein [Microbispora bryophytorum]|nr:hypothetical protein [Microbispora bryophytorum]